MTSAKQNSCCWMPRKPGDSLHIWYFAHHFVNVNINLFFHSRNKAEGVKSTTESVKKALNDAGRAQAAAEKAIQKARNDIGLTQNRLAQVKQL